MNTETLLLLAAALLIKHWIVDFVLQTDEMIAHKKDKIQVLLTHGLQHGAGTFLVFMPYYGIPKALVLGITDFIFHSGLDRLKAIIPFLKAKEGTHAFYIGLGFDQLLHGLTYLFLIAVAGIL